MASIWITILGVNPCRRLMSLFRFSGTKSKFIACEIKKNHLKVGLKGQPPVIDVGVLSCLPVKVGNCFWSLASRNGLLGLRFPDEVGALWNNLGG